VSDDRPPAARRYDADWEELEDFVLEEDRERVRAWLDRTLYEHRAQARAEALQESFHGTWWDRNWFGLAFLGLVAVAMLMIGLINGWS